MSRFKGRHPGLAALLASLLVGGLLPTTVLAAAPTAVNDTFTIGVNAVATTLDVLANDTDPDGDALSVSNVNDPPHGTVVNNGTSIDYAPDASFRGTDSFAYTIADTSVGNWTATVTVIVNDAPVAVDDPGTGCQPAGSFGGSYPIPEDYREAGPFGEWVFFFSQCSLLANDTDPNGDPLTYVIDSGPSHGELFPDPNLFAYKPDHDYGTPFGVWPSDTITYRAFDGLSYSQPATVRLWIAQVNDAPTFTPGGTVTVGEDSGTYSGVWAANLSAGAFEADQTVTFELQHNIPVTTTHCHAGPLFGDLLPAIDSAGVLTFSVRPDCAGSAHVTFRAKDDGGVQGTYGSLTPRPDDTADDVSFDIVVMSDGLATVDDDVQLPEDPDTFPWVTPLPNPWPVNVLGNDAFGPGLTITGVTQGALGEVTVAPDGASLFYAPDPDVNGSDTFTYTLGDSAGATEMATVHVTIDAVNDAPVAMADTLSVPRNAPATGLDVLGNDSDVDGHTLTITGKTDGSNGTVTITGGGTALTYRPNPNVSGSDTFTYTVTDGFVSVTASVAVTITGANVVPVAAGDPLTISEDAGAISIPVLLNDTDADDDPLTITANTDGTKGTVTIIAGGSAVAYTPDANANGTDSFTYTISDGHGGTATATVSVTITPVNDVPIAAGDIVTIAEDALASTILVLANDTDADGDAAIITGKTNAAKGAVTITGVGTGITYKPNLNATGADSFTYTISDGQGGTSTATVSVTISPVNDMPIASADVVTIAEDAAATTILVLANDTDVDGDARTITAKTNGAKGVVTLTGTTSLTYKPNANANGADSFTYAISDGHGGTAIGTVSVTISSVNDAPNAGNDAGLSVPESAGPTALNVKANDSDVEGDGLTITARTNGSHGTVVITGGGSGLTYDPVDLYHGPDAFTYTINDGHGGSDTATVVVTVAEDTTNPSVIGPGEAFYAQTVASSSMNARISWSGTDAGTGIARYDLQVSVNGGPFTSIALATLTSTSIDRTLTDEQSYRFRIRATDKGGNVGAWINGPTFRPGRVQNNSSGVVYAGPWATLTTSLALGGSHRFASSLSARASLTRTVRDLAWVATKTPTAGSAQVWIDGALAATINTRASTTSYRQLVYSRHFSTLGSHTIEIRAIGGGPVYLDAFLVMR